MLKTSATSTKVWEMKTSVLGEVAKTTAEESAVVVTVIVFDVVIQLTLERTASNFGSFFPFFPFLLFLLFLLFLPFMDIMLALLTESLDPLDFLDFLPLDFLPFMDIMLAASSSPAVPVLMEPLSPLDLLPANGSDKKMKTSSKCPTHLQQKWTRQGQVGMR